MRILLDTHAFLWWLEDDPQLSVTARQAIEATENQVFVSAVSGWEIAIKISIGKMTLPEPPEILVPRSILEEGFQILPIFMEHTLQVGALPFHHRDPFDRLLIAQSIVESIPLVTVDSAFAPYPVKTLW